MKSIKLKDMRGKIKYIKRDDNYPIEVGEIISMKWGKEWVVVKIIKRGIYCQN